MLITSKISVDLQSPGTNKVVYAVQKDENSRAVEISLFDGGVPWTIPPKTTCAISFKKPDGSSGLYDTLPDGDVAYTISDNKITITMASQMLTVAGNVPTSVVMYKGLLQLGTFPFTVIVEPRPSASGGISNDYYNYQNFAEVNQAIGNLNNLATVNKSNLVSAINESIMVTSNFKNLLNLSNVKLLKGYFHNETLGLYASEDYDCFQNVPLTAGVTYKFSPRVRFVYNVNTGKNIISNDTSNLIYTPPLANGDIIVDISVYKENTTNMKVFDSTKYTENDVEAYGEDPNEEKEIPTKTSQLENDSGFITEDDLPFKYKNIFNSKGVSRIENAFNKFGTIYQDPESIYSYFTGVKITKGVKYTVTPDLRFICKTSDGTKVYEGKGSSYTFTSAEDMTVDVSFFNKDIETIKMFNADKYEESEVEAFNKSPIIPNGSSSGNSSDSSMGNVLYGKKWVACGDSFTEGTSDDVFEDGKFAGKNKVYPYFIGMRNNMDIVNEAISGTSMAYDPDREDYFSNTRYQNIDPEADYITLWFGINDEHKYSADKEANKEKPEDELVCRIGEIKDRTNETFCGAWNIVMEHLIRTHPYAKIGIIITNGSTPAYTEAERNIAKRWGVPYLDLQADYQVPLMHRVTQQERPELCEDVINIRKANFWVSSTDGHPNSQAHEYQSTFIENWLRSL